MLSLGKPAAFARTKTEASLALRDGSALPVANRCQNVSIQKTHLLHISWSHPHFLLSLPRTADTISNDSFEKRRLFLASLAPLVCLTLLHLLCPYRSPPKKCRQEQMGIETPLESSLTANRHCWWTMGRHGIGWNTAARKAVGWKAKRRHAENAMSYRWRTKALFVFLSG